MKKMIRSMCAVLSLCVGMGIFLCGCDSKSHQAVIIEREPYEKISYQTAYVQRGELKPSVALELRAEGYEQIKYRAVNEELEVENLHVSVGDKVEKGDLLVSFKSDSINQTIADYEEEKKQKELLVEHYENLMRIDAAADYQADIKMLKQDIYVAQLYIEEAEKKLSDYQIVAKEAGTITEISEYLQNGYYNPGANFMTEVCGTGNYSARTEDAELFTVGETYVAKDGVVSCELRLTDISEGVLTFEPVSDMSAVSESDTLTLTVEKPELSDVVYVDKAAVQMKEGEDGTSETYFVYVVKENGFRRAVPVTTGDTIDNYIVITQGLEGGEKVTLK